ncbi:zinc finger, CCHC-type containing protein [Tanacetum coccineum]|uniref:Zinc finger, CCHC-type containing protein n=1 Tax=Tanacetum coccineum TaxID=301880 RepID=A0ABQ5F7G4_9ASTR
MNYDCYYSRINQGEVRTTLQRMGRNKAVGPDPIPIEAWRCLEDEGVKWLTRLFNKIFLSVKIPEELRLSEVIPIYKNKGDTQACSNYRGIKLLSHSYRDKVKKGDEGVREPIRFYAGTGVKTRVRTTMGNTEFFPVDVGLHQGSTISPYLFTLILDELSREIQESIPWCRIFADDIVLIAESTEELNNKIERWREALEDNGLRVSRENTEYLRCDFGRYESAGWFTKLSKQVKSGWIKIAEVGTWVKPTHGRSSYANNAENGNDATRSSAKAEFPSLSYGTCFIFWYTHLSLEHDDFLSRKQFDKENYLEHPIPAALVAQPGQQVPPEALAAHAAWVKGQKEVAVLMLLTMDLDIQQNLAHLGAYDMLQELKAMFSKQAKQEFLQTVREFHTCKQEEGQSVSSHVLKMKSASLTTWKRPSCQLQLVKTLYWALEKELSRVSRRIEEKEEGLQGSKKLEPGALSLYVGDGHRAAVEAIGTYHLELPSGLVIVLNNCHYAPSITRGVISVSRLFDDGFINRFDDNNVILVSKNNLVYFIAVPRDDSYLLWHCRLGHISKKRIEKLQHDGLLNSIDIESLGKCVSCLSGKMARKSYSHQVERAKDLIGLIYTDVCGPFRIVSRQGASYFVTFTDDFSRYSYVYLLKHKHEVFETFKVFQKEVENQPGKTINSLRSDRGGKYMSQEFLDHLKEHGIIAHCTPPYTPQNNEVSERRNRTLLDMVRSMNVGKQEALHEQRTNMDDIRAIRILIAIAAYYDYEIWQMDVKNLPQWTSFRRSLYGAT